MGRAVSWDWLSSNFFIFLYYQLLKLKPFFSMKPITGLGISLLAVFPALLIIASQTLAQEEYRFERMWPTLQQPWYFYDPLDATVDDNGNIYVADTGNHRIQKFTDGGQFVGKWGSKGGGDGKFNDPSAVAIDSSGYLYVVDTSNQRIQKFTLDGEFIGKWGNYGSGDGEFLDPLGIAIDSSDYVYVVDEENHCVQKFTSEGDFVAKWGREGSGNGEFESPSRIAIDSNDYLYVADTDNQRIQKLTSEGEFVATWGTEGEGDGEFGYPHGIAIDSDGYLYVTDTWNHRIQKFTLEGLFVSKWGEYGNGPGGFSGPEGITIAPGGFIYVIDTYNQRLQKLTVDGEFVGALASSGGEHGEFAEPSGIAIDSSNYVYVADSNNHRIQKFTSDGQFVATWGNYDGGDGQFSYPTGIVIDSDGYVYVTDIWNYRVQKFTTDGQFVAKWGDYGSGDGEFDAPSGIGTDNNGYLYVADTGNQRIQKFTSNGQFIAKWGSYGSGDGQFADPQGIAIDNDGYVYVADTMNYRIQKFTSDGQFVAKWGGSYGSGDGQFTDPAGVAVDSNDYVYVADTLNYRIQKFTSDGQFVAKWGGLGSDPGMFSTVSSLALDSSGRAFVCDHGYNRIQVFTSGTAPPPSQKKDKVIIVAGGGPFAGNNIWDATQLCANFAYRALTYQGFTKDTIYYLSSDTDLDLDGNGLLDDVDADATNNNFQAAITTWAQDADNLLIYMIDHGGNGTFRMGETELLQASTLGSWLDTAQGAIPGTVVLVYDACRSGSFLASLLPPSGKERVVLTSASANEEAIFCSGGSISFSFFFWGHIFNGDSFYDSFVNAKNSIGVTYSQNPLLDGNGNGIGNERADQDAARLITIGNGTRTGADIPVIGSVAPAQSLDEETLALLYAANVIDADGISRVWAVITPPGYSPGSPDNPVTDLPILELQAVGNNRYEGTYTSFTETGTYNVAIYAADAYGIISLPVQTTVEKGVEPPALNVFGFTTDLTGPPAVQTQVEITFTAQGDSGPLYYRYYQASGYQTQNYGNWQKLQDWTTDNSLTWFSFSDDHYILVVHVTDDTSSNNFHQAGLSIETSGNSSNPIQITGFTTGMNYPQSSGTAISFDTTASGGSGTLYYKYYYRKMPYGQWTEVRGYDANSASTWTPSEDGVYVVVVWVTDDPTGSTFSTAGITCTIGE